MPHGPTIFPSKGRCIYCGATGVKLNDEHIVPLSLGGQHVLDDASCSHCEKITTRFERKVARELWGDARISFGMSTRRPKQRATHIEMRHPTDPSRTVQIPAADYPAGFLFYRMDKAGFLQGLPETSDISGKWQLVVLSAKEHFDAFRKKYGIEATLRFNHVPDAFGRLIAKIGYGHILTLLDPADFRPICLPYIRGEKANVSYVVGSATREVEPQSGKGYWLSAECWRVADRMLLIALVRLIANAPTPDYHVVVGEVVGADEVTRVFGKLGTFVDVDSPEPITPDIEPGLRAHR